MIYYTKRTNYASQVGTLSQMEVFEFYKYCRIGEKSPSIGCRELSLIIVSDLEVGLGIFRERQAMG